MATVAISDIHGNSAGLDELLAQIGPELRPADTVVFLGDYIDRGIDTSGQGVVTAIRLPDETVFQSARHG